VQKEEVDEAEIERRFRAFASAGAEVMSAYELEAYILSAFNQLDYSPADMDLPLNQYYVSTSHNTYLMGDQLVGTAAVEGYVHALLRGCSTTRILFEDVVIAISRYAFAASPYPVILSFETHCSLPQQVRMAAILKRYLGSIMVLAPVGGENEVELPSPNQLKYRIIIKNKVLEPPKRRRSTVTGGHSRSHSVRPEGTSQAGQQNQQEHTVSPRTSTAQLKRKVAPELSELIVYCKAVHFEGFEGFEGPEPAFDQITSVSESASNQLMRQHPKQYAKYNALQMTRVYPSFSRFTSTNFNPISHWATGCQLVALNFQTLDRNMQLYESMFHSSLGAGYVPKPMHLREAEHSTCGGMETPVVEDDETRNDDDEAEDALESSPQLRPTMSWGASLASPVEMGAREAAPALRRTTVHICVISAHNVAMEAAGIAGGAGGNGSGSGSSRRASNVGLMISSTGSAGSGRRGSFSTDFNSASFIAAGADSLGSAAAVVPEQCVLTSPSDVAMFSNADPTRMIPTPLTPAQFTAGFSLLNAAAAVAAADAVANLAASHHQKPAMAAAGGSSSSRIRIEVEWISEGSGSGQQKNNRQSVEDATTLVQSALGGGGGLSALHSLHGTAPNSPPVMPPPQGGALAGGYPFMAMSASGSSLVTPLNAPPPAPTPLGHSSGTAALNKGQSSKSRYVTGNGMVRGSEIWWRDESLFRVVSDPEISFMRVALMDDDAEVASACMSVDSLKEGYRYVELCENDKAAGFGRPIQVLIHVQMSQLHCLALPIS
ncbi:phospholipase, partial [Coemansia sp. RSA 1933]